MEGRKEASQEEGKEQGKKRLRRTCTLSIANLAAGSSSCFGINDSNMLAAPPVEAALAAAMCFGTSGIPTSFFTAGIFNVAVWRNENMFEGSQYMNSAWGEHRHGADKKKGKEIEVQCELRCQSVLSVILYISQCTHFATLNITWGIH